MTALPDYSNRWVAGNTITATRMNDMGQGGGLFAKAQVSPDMTILVSAGRVYFLDQLVINYAGGSSPVITAPTTNPYIAVLTIDNTGTLAWTYGSEAASPTAPVYPKGKFAICEVYCRVGMTHIDDTDDNTNGYISNDARFFNIVPHMIAVANSYNLQCSHDVLASTSEAAYTKLKTITFTNGFQGSMTVFFDMKTGTAGNAVYGQIYKDNVAWGTERSTTLSTYTTFSETFSGLNLPPGTAIQIYAKGSYTANIINFRIGYNLTSDSYSTSTP